VKEPGKIGGCRLRPILVNEDAVDGGDVEEVDGDDVGEEVVVDQQEADDGGEEDAGVRVKLAPTQPSKTEMEKHEVTHCPFRSWCPTCVAGRGQKSGHRQQKRDGGELPRFSMDYGFMGAENQPSAVLLVVRELRTGMMHGMIVAKKGVGASWVEQRIANFMNGFGYKKVLLRSDNENSIVALRRKIVTLVDAQVLQEDSIQGESQTNGLAEVGVKILEGMIRTLKIAVETRIGEELESSSVLLAWLAEHAAVVYNRCAVMADGRSPWQRAYGKASTMPLLPFGEKVLYKPLKKTGDHKNSLQAKFNFAFYLGSRSRSGEHFVGTSEGVVRCRDVRRLTLDKRWDLEGLKGVTGAPWAPVSGESSLEVPTNIVTKKVAQEEQDGEYRPDINIKRMMIRKADVIKYGKTPGCAGCRALLEGDGRRQSHTEGCRSQMEKRMEADPVGAEKVERNKRRVQEELGREVEKRVKHAEAAVSLPPPAGPEIDVKMEVPVVSSSSSSSQGQGVTTAPVVAPSSVDAQDDEEMGGGDGAAKRRRLLVVTEEQRPAMMMRPASGTDIKKRYWDDLSGEELDHDAVVKGELEELEFIRKSGLYIKVDRSAAGGNRVIGTRWVRTNKGTQSKPNIRCRLVATEVKRYEDESLFAATPPLEALKILIGMAAARRWRLVHIDVRRAYFNAAVLRDVFVELDKRDKMKGEENMVGKLQFAMYGTRDAASSWEACYTQCLVEGGFVQGKSNPCVFVKGEVMMTVHGDDFTFTGPSRGVDEARVLLSNKFEVKTQQLNPGDIGEEMIILNRRVLVTEDGYQWEPDSKHALRVIKELGLDGEQAKGSAVTGARETPEEEKLRERPLGEEEQQQFRSLVASLNYLAMDRPDIGFATKELCRAMSSATELDMLKLKRMGRYLVSHGNVATTFQWGCGTSEIFGYSDSDHGGSKDRKSTSGGVITFAGVVIKSWSKHQKVIALSSGEAELYAAVKVGCELKGIKSLCKDFGLDVSMHLYIDAKATLGMLSRKGVGSMKHVETNMFWMQSLVASKCLTLHKIHTDHNFADLLTKYLTGIKSDALFSAMGFKPCALLLHRQ